jgi:dihydroorotase
MTSSRSLWRILIVLLALLALQPTSSAQVYDVVITGGHVIDPESGLDAVRNIGIKAGTIATISRGVLQGRRTIDASGLVVAPGFIDLHQHSQTDEAYRAKVCDGVTSALEMEEGVPDINQFYSEREGKALINFGAAIGHQFVRKAVLDDDKGTADATKVTPALSKQQMQELRRGIEFGLRRGAVGVGILMLDTPDATPYEILQVFRAAAEFRGAPVHIHVRDLEESQYWLETDEVLADSLLTGAPAQIVHANSSYHEDAPLLFDVLMKARERGLDVTTEAYPYTTSAQSIDSLSGWEKWPDSKFQKLEWAATGERLTRASFAKYRGTGGLVIAQAITEDVLLPSVTSPLTMIASDGILKNGVGHPRVAGTYSRVLGRYVRDQKALGLMEALRKMTIMPAQHLETRVPQMRKKGRISVGADADITVFDPATVIDRATYREPSLPSVGIEYVLVNGTVAVNHGKFQSDVLPGRAIRAAVQ